MECVNFCFFYDARRILDNINFRLEYGAWLSIIGPNGSGKSTLLKNMLRLVHGKTTGEMLIAGKSIKEYAQKQLARLMAYVPQAGGRVPPFTVKEFINLSRYSFGSQSNAQADKSSKSIGLALELTHTTHLADRRMDQLSGGQRQRAFLAAALAQETPVLLLDEPASFLDPKHAHAMNELLKELHNNRNLTIITVTHDLNQPLDAGGEVLVLQDSKQIYFGSTAKLEEERILDNAFCHDFCYLKHPKTGKTLVIA